MTITFHYQEIKSTSFNFAFLSFSNSNLQKIKIQKLSILHLQFHKQSQICKSANSTISQIAMKPLKNLLILSLILTSCLAWNPKILDEDTIEISAEPETENDASFHRLKRETPAPPSSRIPLGGIKINCKTSRNEEGICKPFKECYPLFLLRGISSKEEEKALEGELKVPGKLEHHHSAIFELESIYRNVSGPCDKDVLTTLLELDLGKGKVVPMTEYVCCPNEKSKPTEKPNRPPAPTTPKPDQMIQNKKCGKTFVHYKAEELTPETDPQGQATDPLSFRIVNGRVAERGEFPWTVALMNSGRQFCGGSLISDRHVLTAAHCVYYMNKLDVNRIRVHLGDHNIYSEADGPHEVRSVSNVYYHRQFSMDTLYHDVSVIRLSKPVTFTKYIQPVCLSTGNPPYDTGTTGADVVGWGQIAQKGPQSDILNTVNVRVLTQPECERAYENKSPAGILSGMVCAGGKGRDSCRGDSGGPLTINSHSQATQIGVVSWGVGCATLPGVYTRVDKYLPWISKNQR